VLAAITAIALGGAWVAVPAIWGMRGPVRPTVIAPDPLATPAGLTAVGGCDGWLSAAAELRWDPTADASAYRIYRSEGGAYRLIDTVSSVDVTALGPGAGGAAGSSAARYLDADLGVSLSYAYRVQAVDGVRVSARSAPVAVDTPLLCLT
jgi:hypothetical protein